MQIDEFLDLVRKRRSIRRIKPDPIPDEWVDKVLEAGRWAMSGANGQPWEFIVVKDPETKAAMSRTWIELQPEIHAIEKTHVEELVHPIFNLPFTDSHPMKDAPVLIVILGDRRTFQATVLSANYIICEGGPDAAYMKNIANAAQNMHLAVAALGLGSQWLSVYRPWELSLREILNVPPMLEIHSVVVLGYPAYTAPPSYRRELSEIVHYEKYDMSKYRTGAQVIDWMINASRRSVKKADKAAFEK